MWFQCVAKVENHCTPSSSNWNLTMRRRTHVKLSYIIFFPKGRNVGGNCYRPYRGLPKIKLAEFTVLPNAHRDSAWSEKCCRTLNTITSRKKWIGGPWLPCFIIAVRLSCVYAFNHKNENLPNPSNMSLHQELFSCVPESVLLPGSVQESSLPHCDVPAHPSLHSWPRPGGNCLYLNKPREY